MNKRKVEESKELFVQFSDNFHMHDIILCLILAR